MPRGARATVAVAVTVATGVEHPALDDEGRRLLDAAGAPAVLELELIEPSLFLDVVPGTAEALARAIVARLSA